MSKKQKASVRKPFYFDAFRDYSKAVAAEFAFFKGLLDAKEHIRGIPSNQSLQIALKEVTGFLQDQGRPLDIVVKFSVIDPRSNDPHTLLLGTQLKPPQGDSQPQVTHSLCLADNDSLLAKVHSDLDFHEGSMEKKPSPHTQMGGRVSKFLLKHCPNKEPKIHWHQKMDKPRLPALPTCTALLWHWAFLEYQSSEQASDFLKAEHWKRLVKQAEASVLSPFFSDGVRLITHHPADGLLNALYVPLNK